MPFAAPSPPVPPSGVRLFLCGDVMTGRGIDQVLPHPGHPELFERWMRSAEGYVELAEQACGPMGRALDFGYPWGEALAVLREVRVLVFAFATPDSGTPAGWAPTATRDGVNVLDELSARTADQVAQAAAKYRRTGDIVVVSMHWGGNWGFDIPAEQRVFAHRLIDAGGADIVYGHSSHHVKGLEIYRGKLILYGCGDFLNDYEGISGHDEAYRPGLTLMYFPQVDGATGHLSELRAVPMRIRRFHLERAGADDAAWLRETLATYSPSLRGAWQGDSRELILQPEPAHA